MFGIGGMELLVILLVALLVLGPERLPEITRWIAKVTREIRKAGDEVRMHLDPGLMRYASTQNRFFSRMEQGKDKMAEMPVDSKQFSQESEQENSASSTR